MNKMGSGFAMLQTSRKRNIILTFLGQLAIMRWWAGWGRKRKVLELCKFGPLSSTLLHSCEELHQLTLNLTPLEGQLILRVQQHENVKSTFCITHHNFSSVLQWVTFEVEESKAPLTKFRWVGSQSTPVDQLRKMIKKQVKLSSHFEIYRASIS